MSIEYQIIEQKDPHGMVLHGEEIFDYYDWLENDSKQRNEMLQNEADTLDKYLALNLQKNKWPQIREIFHNSIDYELFSDVQLINGHIFYSYRNFSKSIYKPIFKKAKSLKDEQPRIVFNSNKIHFDSVIEHEYSPNGKYCALTISNKREMSIKVMVIDVDTAETHGNCLQLFSFERIAWSGDSKGFFIYYDSTGEGCRNLYYHYLDENKPDKLIENIHKSQSYEISFEVSYDHKYLILYDSQALYAANIESLEKEIQFKIIFKITENITYSYVGNEGDFFLFLKNIGAPMHHLIEIDITDKKPGHHFEVVVAENLNGHGVLKAAYAIFSFVILIYIENFQSSMYIYSLVNQRIDYKVHLNNEQVVSSKIDKYGVFFETRSFKTPRKVYRIEFNQLEYRQPYVTTYLTIEPILWKESKIPNLDRLGIKVQYDSYKSFDQTNVSMTIIQKDGNNNCKKPCIVYAYGGFGDSLLPRFDLYFLLFVELFNGVVVFMHIRGGGELGDVWSLKSSQIEISFKDLIAGVEYLKCEPYANIIDLNKIAFHGMSHGGLVGAVTMNLRPNLFTAVTLLNGYFDLINDLLDGDRLNQYGNINKKQPFNIVKRYAPLLHIHKPTKSNESYPITLIVASKKDDVVSISNSLKYLAHRREKTKNNQFQRDKPILLKVINSGGHNYKTANRRDFIDAVFVKLQFLAEAMELKCDVYYQYLEKE